MLDSEVARIPLEISSGEEKLQQAAMGILGSAPTFELPLPSLSLLKTPRTCGMLILRAQAYVKPCLTFPSPNLGYNTLLNCLSIHALFLLVHSPPPPSFQV